MILFSIKCVLNQEKKSKHITSKQVRQMYCREGSEGVDGCSGHPGTRQSLALLCLQFLPEILGGLQFPKATESVSFLLFHVDFAC